MDNKKTLEVLAPAGDFERFNAAVDYGADAVYLGGKGFGMRASPDNFNFDELKKAVEIAHQKNIKVYPAIRCQEIMKFRNLVNLF